MSGQQPRSSARQTLIQAEEQYNKRIDDDVAKLVDCFSDIVRVGEVRSTESLLSLITELKQHLLLNDTDTLSQLMKQRTTALDTQREEIKNTICTMRHELATTIYDLESVYFRSLSS
ncbi:hypothetical protein K492DRAFT_138148 [Lichtheimia hyalospora FSU 10163]|nr:hypothetical protein K492DRAFT_138148 [Lichtheimia hyalospora FSU 10163]